MNGTLSLVAACSPQPPAGTVVRTPEFVVSFTYWYCVLYGCLCKLGCVSVCGVVQRRRGASWLRGSVAPETCTARGV